MNVVELYTTTECGLCKDAKQVLLKLQKDFPFRLSEQVLTEQHPKYEEYLVSVPVVILNGTQTFAGQITEPEVRAAMAEHFKPTRALLVFKFLEALGFVTVGTGLFYGVTRNDEWQELYFLIAGVVLFAAGRILEKREIRKARL
jgi:glutaredoxin